MNTFMLETLQTDVAQETTVRQKELFWKQVSRQRVNPPGNDPQYADYCSATLEDREEGGVYAGYLDNFIDIRSIKTHPHDEGMTAEAAVNINRAFVLMWLSEARPQLFAGTLDKRSWKWAINAFAEFVQGDAGQFPDLQEALQLHLLGGNLPTTHPGRVGPPELYLQTRHAHDDIGSSINVLSLGCSVGVMERQWVAKNEIPMLPISIVERIGGQSRYPTMLHDPEATFKANELINRPTLVNEITGLDIMGPQDNATRMLARAALRKSAELDNEVFMKTVYDPLAQGAISAESARRVRLFQADFTNKKQVADIIENHLGGQQFDIILASTVIDQLSPDDFENVMQLAQEYGTPDSRLLAQEFGYARNGLQLYLDWYSRSYAYRLFEINPRTRDVLEVMRSDGGRAANIRLSGRIALGNSKPVSMRKLVMSA